MDTFHLSLAVTIEGRRVGKSDKLLVPVNETVLHDGGFTGFAQVRTIKTDSKDHK